MKIILQKIIIVKSDTSIILYTNCISLNLNTTGINFNKALQQGHNYDVTNLYDQRASL